LIAVDAEQPFRPRNYYSRRSELATYCIETLSKETDPFDSIESIKGAKYEAVEPTEVAMQQTHLTSSLTVLLKRYPKLFSGSLGTYPKGKMHIELMPNAKPVHTRPYAVPHSLKEAFKKELDHLVSIGVLEKAGA
jgi:hypothetical protein